MCLDLDKDALARLQGSPFNSPRGIRCVWTEEALEVMQENLDFQLPEGN